MRSIKNYLNESIENEDYLNEDYLNESILDADKPASLRAAKKEIREWILANCKLRNGSKQITISDDFVVDCNCSVQFRNANTKSLTNGKFKWGYVRDFFKLNFIDFPVFNISDIFINISVVAIVIIIITNEINNRRTNG